jgi:hypothetical protein
MKLGKEEVKPVVKMFPTIQAMSQALKMKQMLVKHNKLSFIATVYLSVNHINISLYFFSIIITTS